jgi:hypothetical protein
MNTVLTNDPKVRANLPAHNKIGAENDEDFYLMPTTERGIAFMERMGGEKGAKKAAKDGRVQVNVRIRPFTRADQGSTTQAVFNDGDFTVKCESPGKEPHIASYDHCFYGEQYEVYDCIGKPMLRAAFEGYNVTLFAYGQTGSGKTHSIMGYGTGEEEGILPRYCKNILGYSQLRLENEPALTVRLSMTFVELYNEQIRDLLEKKKSGQKMLTELQLRQDAKKGIFIENVSIHTVMNWQRIEQLLALGNSQRTVAATNMNATSSRSHSIIIMRLLQKYEPAQPGRKDLESVIHIVDLAGSERQSKTGAEGQQLAEANNINSSLVTLGRVLASFGEGQRPPLRDSKLTRLLSDSFGGNSRTWMLACLSPAAPNVPETISTLNYASSAKKIVNKASVNGSGGGAADSGKVKQLQMELAERMERIAELEEEVEALRAKVENRAANPPDTSSFGAVGATVRRSSVAGGSVSPATQQMTGGLRFIGRAKLSLKNCVLGLTEYNTLPLVVQDPEHDGAALIINTWQVTGNDKDPEEFSDLPTAIKALTGKRIDFCVHVISAEGIPEKFTNKVFCRYVFQKKEGKPLKTEEISGSTEPKWDYKKRFAWSEFTPDLGEYLAKDNVLTFEVIGFP